MPFFTIITSTYNAASTLPRLLDSLASQTCRDFNWIVQDGASSDNTMQIVEQYLNRLPEILADTEKDNGIYDAWNKAINRWNNNLGKWVLFLGADDKLCNEDTLEKSKQILSVLSNEVLFAAGNIYIVNYGSKIEKIPITVNISNSFKKRYLGTPLPHSGLFQNRSLFSQSPFDSTFKIAGDYDFILKHWKFKFQTRPLNMYITDMSSGGISGNSQYTLLAFDEFLKIIKKHSIKYYLIYKIYVTYHKLKSKTKHTLLKTKHGYILWSIAKKIKLYLQNIIIHILDKI